MIFSILTDKTEIVNGFSEIYRKFFEEETRRAENASAFCRRRADRIKKRTRH